jgi:hypothetical protein
MILPRNVGAVETYRVAPACREAGAKRIGLARVRSIEASAGDRQLVQDVVHTSGPPCGVNDGVVLGPGSDVAAA